MLGQGLDRLVAEGRVGEVLEDDVGGVGAGLEQGPLAALAELDDQPQGVGAAPDLVDQPGGGDVPEVPGDRLGLVALEQLVDVRRIDPEQDQRLIERQGPAQGVEHRAVELDQREAVEPLDPEGFEGERAVVVEGPDRRAEVGRARLQADEREQGQRVGQVGGVARPAVDQVGHADRVGQQQRQGVRVLRGHPPLGGGEAGDLGDDQLPAGVVGPLQAEVFAPAEQDLGGRGVGEGLAEPAEVAGVVLVEVDRLEAEGVEQLEPPEAVGSLDGQGVLAVLAVDPADEVGLARIAGEQLGFGIDGRGGRRGFNLARWVDDRRAALLEGELEEHTQRGQQDDGGKGSLHQCQGPGVAIGRGPTRSTQRR